MANRSIKKICQVSNDCHKIIAVSSLFDGLNEDVTQ